MQAKRGRGRPRKNQEHTEITPTEEYATTGEHKNKINKKYTRATIEDIQGLFDIAKTSVYRWIEAGFPKNEDSKFGSVTFNLYKCLKWKLNSEAEQNVKERIDLERLRKLQQENDDTAGLKIDRKEMEDILKSRALSLRSFLERGLPMNRAQRAMKSVEELVSLDYEFVQSAMEAYMGTRNWKQELV